MCTNLYKEGQCKIQWNVAYPKSYIKKKSMSAPPVFMNVNSSSPHFTCENKSEACVKWYTKKTVSSLLHAINTLSIVANSSRCWFGLCGNGTDSFFRRK